MEQGMPLKRKRRRRTLACEECRRRKVRCDRELPCTNCVQAYKPEHCFYQPDPMAARSPPPRQTEHEQQPQQPQQQQQPHQQQPSAGLHGLAALSGVAAGVMAGTLESEWPASPSPARYHGHSHGNHHGYSHSHGHNHGHGHHSRHDHHRYLSPSRGLLPGFSSVSGSESEVSALKDQVRRLESRLASVLAGQDLPPRPPSAQTTRTAPILPPLSPRPPRAAGSTPAHTPTPSSTPLPLPLPVLPPPTQLLTNGYRLGGPLDQTLDGTGEKQYHRDKTQYISRGHWMNGALLTLMKPLFEQVMRKPETRNGLEKCKSLGRTIKANRTPSLLQTLDVGRHVPARQLADELVSCYFRTFESVYRILHIPTFMQAYQRYWEKPSAASTVFIVQMQLCMAIGVCFYDDTCSLRHLAAQWIYEAQVWQMAPAQSEKARMTVAGLQTMCLLHLARETSSVGADLLWVSAGSLIRSAMYLGLHRDPSCIPKIPRFLAEIRRRLWVTVLELSLQSSFSSGGPPLVDLDDFDSLPPANFFDDQLAEKNCTSGSVPESGPASTVGALPPPYPPATFTDTSIQIALFRSFPTRLAVAHNVNDFRNPGSYDETLRLNSELRSGCQSLSATMQSFCTASGTGKMRPSTFHLRLVEHLTQRCFLSLNQAFLAASQNDPKYYFSRKVSVDTALKLFQGCGSCQTTSTGAKSLVPDRGTTPPPSSHWSAIMTSNSNGDSGGGGASVSSVSTSPGLSSRGLRNHGFPFSSGIDMADEPTDFHRLCVTASGAFRSVPVQCFATLSMELMWQLEEEHSARLSLGIVGGRGTFSASSLAAELDPSASTFLAMPGVMAQSVLLESVEQAVLFTEKRVTAGETNVKGILFLCAVLSQAQALMRGADKEEMEQTVVADCDARLKHCVEQLRVVAARHTVGSGASKDDAPTSPSFGPEPAVGGGMFDSQGMNDLSVLTDANMPIGGDGWAWEDLVSRDSKFGHCARTLTNKEVQMQNQDFTFKFNTGSVDPFFPVI
ncbi:c6 zinc finger domain containing protein [Grosmannia clavigera kw1407]|uniref:C6 zinc finger domain containing protein n=1 Tax=Grosmannia clavigera (strain kw1407 / UAMH 11150) TaxID=655863 RepID=F0XCC3_GROCL|nr:c6 zinc finger domain containing protein [Grosmannia clavigera kw1407]EFX04032.1 c6 zinc finger domain containing protein [Grosmannia clavigera kw1407]